MDNLPENVLFNIFNCSKSLKDLTLVCKKFEELISNNSELIMKFPLVLREKMITEKYEEIIKSKRRYNAVIIRFDYKFSENGMNILRKFASSIRFFEAIRCIFTIDQFRNILEELPNLESLKISSTFIQCDNNEMEPLSAEKIKNLKKFTFRSSDERIFDLIKFSKLKMINISSVKAESRRFEEFFVGQQHLQVIDGSFYFSKKLLDCFPNLNCLDEITLEMDKLMLTETEQPLILSQSVRKLNLYGTAEDQQMLPKVLLAFPNLKSLSVTENKEFSLSKIRFASLSKLSITDCKFNKNFKFNLIEIPTLKSFEFDKIEEIEDWKIFARKNPKIEELILRQNYEENQEYIDAEVSSQGLKERVFNIDDLSEEKLKLFTGKLFFHNLKILRLVVQHQSVAEIVVKSDSVKKQFEESGILLFLK